MGRLLPRIEVVPTYVAALAIGWFIGRRDAVSDDVANAFGAALVGGGATLFGLVLTAQGIILSAAVSSERVQGIIAVRHEVATAVARVAVRCEMWLGGVTALGIALLLVGKADRVHVASASAAVAFVAAVRLGRLSAQTRALLMLALLPSERVQAPE